MPTDFPATYGAWHWYLWWYGHWRVRATIEYTGSDPRNDARFPACSYPCPGSGPADSVELVSSFVGNDEGDYGVADSVCWNV